ncbi:MAG: hypothetical protein ABSE89_08030 [Sedimentisphaerales bacterium]
MNQVKKRKSAGPNDINLYTALAIFVNNASRLIDVILDAAQIEDLSLTEETAARLSLYSDNARLTGFTKNINNLIIAARERKMPVVRSEAEKLREIFEQMTKCTNKTELEKRIALEEKAARIAAFN